MLSELNIFHGMKDMSKLLLHTCCGPCAIYVARQLRQDHEVSLYFFNPNIQPEEEYKLRWQEIKKWADKDGFNIIKEPYDNGPWFKANKGLENESEGGARCLVCYRFRLEQVARYTREHGYDIFTTTLSISPHKKADNINLIGDELAKKYGVKYLEADWKKQDGFKHSCELSREQGFYRQDYCGYIFSRAERLMNNNSILN